MPRFHLFEFEDQQWFPEIIRNYMTDFLQFVANAFKMFKDVTPILKKGIEAAETNEIIDLASGGGGAWLSILDDLEKQTPDIKITLTDYYPNLDAFKRMKEKGRGLIDYSTESVNALQAPENLKGLRTMFLTFHHFKPEEAQQILQNAVDHNMPIAIFEAQKRDVAHLIKFMLSPINVVLSTPFIRPFKLGRIIFTYLIPIVPILVFWDGLVSVLRTYSVEELSAMSAKLEGTTNYDWEIAELKSGPVTIPYLLGCPK